MKNEKQIKCLIWDLDNTIWQGTLAEHDTCPLKPDIVKVLESLDGRGILMSIASANDGEPAVEHLERAGIAHLFIHPMINWENKTHNIKAIARRLGISLDTIGFIDDEPFELAQVQMVLPEVRTYPAEQYEKLPDLPEFTPQYLTDESKRRREMYVQSERRAAAKKAFHRNRSEFLKWTQTSLTFRVATGTDLERIMELMNRTSQLNATGEIYDREQVRRFMRDSKYAVYTASLRDRFVDYGKIGVAICRRADTTWRLIAFLVSCRVLSRGISGIFLNLVRHEAHRHGARQFEAFFRRQSRNRKMQMLYTLNGLAPTGTNGEGVAIYSGASRKRFSPPDWLEIIWDNRHEEVSRTAD